MIDLGSTCNYLSARRQTTLELRVKPKEEFERLMLADGSEAHAQGYSQFVLHCGNYKTKILAQVFSNLHDELIVGTPWLVKENTTIDWATGRVIVERDGVVYTLPCYHQYLNKPEDREDEGSDTKGISFICAKAIQRRM